MRHVSDAGMLVSTQPRRPTKQQRLEQRREAARQAALARQRRRRLLLAGGIAGATVVLAVVVLLIVANTGGQSAPAAAPIPSSGVSWAAPAPGQVRSAVTAAGLPLLSAEATDVHFHAHVDIYVNGQPVTVPANIGIAAEDAISSMHTHDNTGIIHIESPSARTFTLGQFFIQWQVPLSKTCINSICNTSTTSWRFSIDGQNFTGDPATITLASHQEITATYGAPPPSGLPTGYPFPSGL
jgi:hypothetical protein